MKPFYHYMLQYRGVKDKDDPRKRLADWMFNDHDFPKQETDYDELSRYLELNSPFPEALQTFDDVWDDYNN
ncbi:hypothetical protein CEY16_03325 [Halalkalibacillus sediminis]|uniref:YozE SAM-like domain-containing protein n=1 Tax=Halalkalibacillus sediminis TaxID=2018042 RepID=A0A2I0QWW5_9BACI|nr:YozE family protein [Halalkalibacillus sediminis]PKR78799.1 hypothetical protein CEY16_03325 [Halalkalibacillus sediminis]